MSMFDADSFLSAAADAGSTLIVPLNKGFFPAVINDVKARTQEIKKGDRIGEPMYLLDITFTITDPEALRGTGKDKATTRMSIPLDMVEKGGRMVLDMSTGKNIRLNRAREGLGQNTAGWSPRQLLGVTCTVRIDHRQDTKEPKQFYDEVNAVYPFGYQPE